VFWKIVKRTKFVSPAEADLMTGKLEADAECKVWDENPEREEAEMTRVERLWDALW